MPELPEVETNTRNLAAWARGKTITGVVPPKGARERMGLSAQAFRRRLTGRRINGITRRGKWILVRLTPEGGLGLHLGMTGKLARATRKPLPRFTRAAFTLGDGSTLCFVDSRRFGRLVAEATYVDLVARREIAEVGPDALSELTPKGLAAALVKTNRTVKEALLDQRLLAGVGNLYAAEALWRARIHPLTKARTVAADPALNRLLWRSIRAALRHGLGTFPKGEVPEYIEDGAPNPFHAYDRQGLPCHRCGTTLEAMTIGGRTTAFCPLCQPW